MSRELIEQYRKRLDAQDEIIGKDRQRIAELEAALRDAADMLDESADDALLAAQKAREVIAGEKGQDNGWYCERCMQIVSGKEVTFEEHHENCGGKCV